jgi:hypothetical protein
MRRAVLQKGRLKERRDIGAAVTNAQRPTSSGQKRRFDRASAASGLAQQPDILSVPRHVSKAPSTEVSGSFRRTGNGVISIGELPTGRAEIQ